MWGLVVFFKKNQAPDTRPELKIYADRCLTCNESERLGTIDFIAKKHGVKVNMRRVYVLPELRKELDDFSGVPMPFIALNNNTLDFFSVGTYMLEDKTLEDFINEHKDKTTNQGSD